MPIPQTSAAIPNFDQWQDNFLRDRLRVGYILGTAAIFVFALLDLTLIPTYRQDIFISYLIMLGGVGVSALFFVSPIGQKHPNLAMLTLGWAYLVVPQIWVTLGGRVIYSNSSWLLTILGVTVLVPVRLRNHIILQASLLGWHLLFNSNQALTYQPENEGGILWAQLYSIIQLIVICVLADASVYLYERLQRRSFEHQQELEHSNEALAQAQHNTVEANRAKNAFLASMSHELLTPLNAVLGYSEILIEEPERPDASSIQADARNILLAGQQLHSLIDNVLALARLEAGELHLVLRTVDVPQELALLAERLRPMLTQRGNAFRVVYTAVNKTMETDPRKLNQILVNLLLNANKFTTDGEIYLQVQDSAPGQNELVFAVIDNGPGIDREEIHALLSQYYQPQNAGTHSKKGVGLGLVICQQYCHLLGGRMEIEHNQPQGAIFRIILPRQTEQTLAKQLK